MTPLFDVHRDLGATFTDFAGRRMPLRCRGDLAEHHAVRRAAGHELSVRVTPLQAGLHRVVAFDTRDFVGAAALRRQPADVLVGLVTGTRRAGCPVPDPASGGRVGAVTSGALSPTIGRPVAMAYVAAGLSAPGTRLAVAVRGTSVDAGVVPLPFYSPQR